MKLFPFRRPSLGLSIGTDKLGLVEVCHGWREPSLRRCAERALSVGLLRLSASESNVTDVSALAQEFSALLDGQGKVTRPVPIALSLPDLCARVALFEFDTLPPKPSELDALVRWRLQKDSTLPTTDVRLTYQVFRAPRVIHILAVAVRESVIGPYEQACELAGLIPVSVGLTSLQLFDLCRPAIETALKTTEEYFYLYVGEGSFAFLAIRAGVPVFLRIKPLRNRAATGNGTSDATPPLLATVSDELLATLQFYMEREAVSGNAPVLSRPLFLVNGDGIVPTLPDSLGVTVVPMGWEDLRIARQPSAVQLFTGLPAYAGVVEA
jgi:Tfp pilus assembly PilM family ATPase